MERNGTTAWAVRVRWEELRKGDEIILPAVESEGWEAQRAVVVDPVEEQRGGRFIYVLTDFGGVDELMETHIPEKLYGTHVLVTRRGR